MTKSQYQRRQELKKEPSKKEIEYTHKAYDIFFDEDAKAFMVVLLHYNQAGEAKVSKITYLTDSGPKASYLFERIAFHKISKVPLSEKWFEDLNKED